MLAAIQQAVRRIDALSLTKPIKIISHYDADGVASAAIIARAFQRWGKKFSLQIVKSLEESFIQQLPENQILIFLDLASGSLSLLGSKKTEVFIFDHHEIVQAIPENVTMVNPLFLQHEPISGAGITYLLAKAISRQNTDLAHLAVIGMVGDILEKNIGRAYNEILKDAEATIKKGLLIYPSTRPLDKALEYSSNPYIPGVTGSWRGTLDVLHEANIPRINGRYKSLYELNDDEMGCLVTAVMLRYNGLPPESLIGNLFLVKFFNKLEDARELSALINACSRMDAPATALGFCLGNKKCKEEAGRMYIEYKQHLVAALKHVAESDSKIVGKNYEIINARDCIKDTIIGTVASIISNSPAYTEGTIIVALAYNEDKIKVSARIAGRNGRNVRDVLHRVVVPLGGEVGGHPAAAGCSISREKEAAFITELQKVLEVEVVKV